MKEPKQPRTPTYTTREKIAIRLFGTCKKMNAYAVAMREYKTACKEWEKYVEQCRYDASIIRTPCTPARTVDIIHPTKWVTDPKTGCRYTVANYREI